MKKYPESDWKTFQAMVPVLRERYLAERTGRIAALLTNPKKNDTERFWDAMEEMEKEAEVLRYCLDGHTRSKMWLFMVSMIHAGMMKKEDLSRFSDELQQSIAYVFDGK